MTDTHISRSIDIGLATGLIGLLVLRFFPHWELAFSRQFFDPAMGWHWNASFWVQAVYHWTTLPSLILAITGVLVVLGAAAWPPLHRHRRSGAFLFAAMAFGPGVLVNSVFKENFHRPRPREVVEFGGPAAYLPLGQAGTGDRGASFPSGHASMGFFLATPYFFLRRRHHRIAIASLLIGVAAGMGIGLVRIMQGAHFLGDVIASGLMVWVIARITWSLMTRFVSSRPSPSVPVAPVTAPMPTPAGYLPGRVRDLDRVAYLRDRQHSPRPLVSIVIPFYNEEANVETVLAEIRSFQPEAEIVAVNDGSSDATWERIEAAHGVVGLSHSINQGQSAAILSGLRRAEGEFCVIMDGDGQNDPADIATLLAAWRSGSADVVCGYRKNRRDTWSRIVASRIANAVRRLFLHDGVRDTGCSLKLFHRDAVAVLPPFKGMHRYLPAFFRQAGLSLQEVPVNHRPRDAGVSKYTNWQRGLIGVRDLIGVGWLLRRHITPAPPTVSHARDPVHL